jgi:hypothetical protein
VDRNVTYKGHQIKAHAIPVAESEDGEWAAHAVVRVPLPDGGREQPLGDPDDRTFPTAEDAEGYAVHIAMRWVDRHGVTRVGS